MAISNFIPQVWAARALESLKKAQVAAAVCTRNYEGDIKAFGDRVHINTLGAVTVGSYTKDTDMNAAQALSDSRKTLIIDQSNYFNFCIDSIDQAQSNPKLMDVAMRESAYALSNTQDAYILGLYTEATNQIGSAASPVTLTTASEAYEYLVKVGLKLDENNVPLEGRYVIVPAWFASLLQLDDRFVKAGTTLNNDFLINGVIGYAAGFEIRKSNNIVTTTGTGTGTPTIHHIIAGYSETIALAEQLVDIQAYTPELRFGDAVKGLHLFGCKVIRPDAMVSLNIVRPTSII